MEDAHSSSNSGGGDGGMIDMNDVSLALELGKGAERMGSVNSPSSWRTTAVTPDSSPPDPASSSSSSSSGSDGEGEGEGKCCGGSGERLPGRRAVRWGDEEEGGELVSEVITMPDFWEEMVFGEGDGEPTELCRFVTELTRGVEATLVFPSLCGVSEKRRRVVLFTDDNGVSICWLKKRRGSGAGGGGASKEPYRIRCETLLKVKDKTVAAAGEGGQVCCEIKLKWLPQPTWSKRSVRVVDIQTESPEVFARGMLQLLSFNTELES